MASAPEQAPRGSVAAKYGRILRDIALDFPEAHEDFPWGHVAVKVGRKVFVFLGESDKGLGVTAKLPETGREALLLPFAEATGYGLGKSGWVSANFGLDEVPPVTLLHAWIEESYRAIAPKKLVRVLDGIDDAAAQTSKPVRRKKA